jgi:two-component system, LytTR family, sensor kinase
MRWFWKYAFPGLFGLLIYLFIRVLNDTLTHFKFWRRDWTINMIEIVVCTVTGYIILYAFNRLFKRFDKKLQHTISYNIVLQELGWAILITQVVVNATIIPMAAFTDDGLSLGDFANINIVPLLFCLIYYMVVRGSRLLQAYVNNKLLLEKVTNDHLQTELKFLKAQYHPHFLFNALNTIYFQMDESVDEAKKSMDKFSELLRYQLYDQQQTVAISRELHYLKNYIELQKVRSSDKLQLQVHFDTGLNNEEVYPLLFLPLVENAFKYVGGNYHICIEAKKENGNIHFVVQNDVPPASTWTNGNNLPRRSGIGLENLKRRLELLYPDSHVFFAKKNGNSFLATLQLQISPVPNSTV